jgi:hypothetical protein
MSQTGRMSSGAQSTAVFYPPRSESTRRISSSVTDVWGRTLCWSHDYVHYDWKHHPCSAFPFVSIFVSLSLHTACFVQIDWPNSGQVDHILRLIRYEQRRPFPLVFQILACLSAMLLLSCLVYGIFPSRKWCRCLAPSPHLMAVR